MVITFASDDLAAAPGDKSNKDANYEYFFGFGSIMNTGTHAPWLKGDSNNSNNSNINNNETTTEDHVQVLPGRIVLLKKSFGYTRQWNFRSLTGFTALGVSRVENQAAAAASEMNGVLFQVPASMVPGFDRREVGYDKVRVGLEDLIFPKYNNHHNNTNNNDSNTTATSSSTTNQQAEFDLGPLDKIWIYVPQVSQSKSPDENHPLLQSYVDTVLQGCLEWGGEAMAEEFILTTGGWSTYFLNDTPSSRRPWLFRKQYDIIDAMLQRHADRTHFRERRHPEEFAAAFHRHMRGMWSIPRRNRNFTGRDSELGQLHARLTLPHDYSSSSSSSSSSSGSSGGWVQVEVAGMGGVGKTQLCVEYCYRQFPNHYGLIVWLTAESSEALVADYRQLLADLAAESSGDVSANKDTDEIIGEVKTRLFRSQVPWLLVFDNLNDRSLLEKFVPRGAGRKGHVLVTTRLVEMEWVGSAESTLVLGCFSPSESVELLRHAAGPENISGQANEEAAMALCDNLGHLPLALGMAAAYMQQCDVQCVEYLERYSLSEQSGRSLLRHGKLHDYSLTVAASLSLSLVAIENESKTAYNILRLLCFLGPDQITKGLLRSLLSAKDKADEEPEEEFMHDSKTQDSSVTRNRLILAMGGLALGGVALMSSGSTMRRGMAAMIILSSSMASFLTLSGRSTTTKKDTTTTTTTTTINQTSIPHRRSMPRKSYTSREYEQTDLVWNILKSFSLFTVKEGKGSMHRLLAEALRGSQSEEDYRKNLNICVKTMVALWKFKPDKPETWNNALQILEHVKAVISYSMNCPFNNAVTLTIGRLSLEAGVFSAMSLNAFIEAQASIESALYILSQAKGVQSRPDFQRTRAEALRELGRGFRYQGNYVESERALMESLQTAHPNNPVEVADTLHELGVLEVKKHRLDSAATYLQQSLDMRRGLEGDIEDIDAQCAGTLHQLALVHVARKPPCLDEAETLLQEALGMSRQIGQRAATLKQLARVTIRRGLLSRAEAYLEQALELYKELYGDAGKHINIAAVKFQQGALAVQCDDLEQAWSHFSECLRIRRHVYAYARLCSADKSLNPTHLEIACVLHELAHVAFAQGRFTQSREMLQAEGAILERLQETSSTPMERLFQARLTNLTWLRKCSKELGDEEEAARLAAVTTNLKKNAKHGCKEDPSKCHTTALHQEALRCRLIARQFVLIDSNDDAQNKSDREKLREALRILLLKINESPGGPMKQATLEFRKVVLKCMDMPPIVRRSETLKACDVLRDVLRDQGLQVNDSLATRNR